jgi:hypothetical protein
MELGRFDGTTTDMRGNAGSIQYNQVQTGDMYLDQTGIACGTAAGTQTFDVTAPAGTNIYSNTAKSLGVTLPSNAGSWSSVSDCNKKENFEDVNGQGLLGKVGALPISTWNY